MDPIDYTSTDSDSSDELMTENVHGVKIPPPTMKSPMPVPNSQSGSLPDSYSAPGVDDERNVYQVILKDIQPSKEANLPDGLLSVSLLRHQKIALAWMVQKEKSVACCGGILADDQGLGKTISMIALILKQRDSSKPNSDGSHNSKSEVLNLDDDDDDDNDVLKQRLVNQRPVAGSLVVCPASVLQQWARELDEKVAEEVKLKVLVYHGGNRTKDPAELAKYDVVLTTYAIVAKEVPTKIFDEEDEDDQRNGDRSGLDSGFANKKRKGVSGKKTKGKKGIDGSGIDCSGTLAKVKWLRVILDEAQTITNRRTQMSKSCCGLRAKRRWCLSGTPMQNNFDELFSYFRFLKCDPYANYKSFCSQIKIPISRNSMQGYMKLQAVLKVIMLRRTKGTLIDGKPIIDLPPIKQELTMVDFSPEERAFYLKHEADLCSQFKTYADAGIAVQYYENIRLMLLRLQKACDHPVLVKNCSSESVSRLSSKMAKNLPKYTQAYLLNLLETLHLCCVCSDPLEDAVVTLCGHVFCYQCVSENLTGDYNTCPFPKCKSPIGADVLFNKSILMNLISDDKGDSSSRIDEESIILQPDYSSSKIKAALEVIRLNRIGDGSSCSGVEGQPIKTVVFSQWESFLDLFEMSLKQYLIQYRRLDDSMSLSERASAVKQFNTDPEVTVMLMSLDDESLGLNMVVASHVIFLDTWWNLTAEGQAINRVHRIGQTRSVTVSRLAVKDTVEERILALRDKKREIGALVFGEDLSKTDLTTEDFKYLFMGID